MNPVIPEIIRKCILIEGLAIQVYNHFSGLFPAKDGQDFWLEMADQEKQHIGYWKQVQNLAEKGQISHIFENPEALLTEIEEIESEITDMQKNIGDIIELEEAFLYAYKLEFIMLHPALAAAFYLLRKETGDNLPEASYAEHIQGLVRRLRQMGRVRPEFELISNLMSRAWQNHLALARQLADIRELRTLVPMCMHCKNVRDDAGYWEKVEKYVGDKMDVSFSHGLCPDCMKKYYKEYVD